MTVAAVWVYHSFFLLLLFMLLLALTVGGSLGRHYITMFEATQNVMLKPTESWREALLDTRIMDLFFTVSRNKMCFISEIQNFFWLFCNSFFFFFNQQKVNIFAHLCFVTCWVTCVFLLSCLQSYSHSLYLEVSGLTFSTYSLYSWPPDCGLFFINKDSLTFHVGQRSLTWPRHFGTC